MKRKLTSIILALSMMVATIPQVFAGLVTEPQYGDDFITNGSFESSMGDLWRTYYSADTAFFSTVKSDTHPNYVKTGTTAMRFVNVGNGGGRGVYYHKNGQGTTLAEDTPGTTYEISAWVTTDADTASVQFLNMDGTSQSYNLTKDTWTQVKYEWTIPAGKGNGKWNNNFRLNTNLTTSIKGSDYDNNATQIGEALDAAGVKFVYVDDISMKVVKKVWADNVAVETSSGKSTGYARASYAYSGINAEGASYVQWQINSENKETGWTNYKKVENINEGDEDSTMITLDSNCADKYLRAQIVPVDEEGNAGVAVNSEPVKINAETNIVSNGSFDWKLENWTGNISLDNGAAAVTGEAEYNSGYEVTATMKMTVSLSAKGTGSVEVLINGVSCGTQEITNEFATYTFNGEVEATDNMKITIKAADALIDNLLVAPQAPSVYDVKIVGTPAANSTVRIDYVYDNSTDDGIREGDTLVEWFIDGEKKGEGKSFRLPNTNGGELVAKVTPVNMNGVSGTTVTSDAVEFYKLEVSNLYITNKGGYKTNGVLVPHYTYSGTLSEKDSLLEWVISDSPNTPVGEWEPLSINGNGNIGTLERGIAYTTASTAPAKGYAPLNQDATDKYVAFRLTPKDSNGREGVAVISEPTPVIEYERNLAINPTISSEMGTTEWDLRTAVTVSDENSTLPGKDDGTGSIYVNAEATKSGWETHPSGPSTNSGYDALQLIPAFRVQEGVTYQYSVDAKWDYSHDMKMNMNILLVSSNGYGQDATMVTTDWTKVTGSFKGREGSEATTYLAIRCWGLPDDPLVIKSGKFLVDNLEIVALQPRIENLKVAGNAEVGETLTASYDFYNTSDLAEAKSKQEWLISDNAWGPWTVYKSQEGTRENVPELTITDDLSNKYIKFRVTPSDRLGSLGAVRSSTSEFFVAPTDKLTYEITEVDNTYSATATFKNVQTQERNVTALLVSYKETNGSEAVVDIAMDSHMVAPGETVEDFSLSASKVGADYARLYFVEGENFDKVRPVDGLLSSYLKKTELDGVSAVINQETKATTVGTTSENPNQFALVFVTKSGETLSGIDATNISDKILYAGLVMTGKEKGATVDFVLDKAEAGTTYTANIAYKNGAKQSKDFKFEGADVAAVIIAAVKNATTDKMNSYLAGEKIDGHDIRDVLFIDTAYFALVEDKNAVTSKIAGIDFTGRIGDIKTIVETESKKQYEYEVWNKNMTDFTNGLNSATTSTLYDLMYQYNDLFGFDLDNEYGFSLEMNAQNKEKFMSEVLGDLKALVGNTNEATSNAIKANFNKIVALAAVNNGAWDKMDNILKEHWNTIGLGTYDGYDKAKKTDMFKDIYNQTFASLSAAKKYIDDAITDLLKKKPSGGGPAGGGGGGGSTTTKKDEIITDRPVSVVDTNKRDDSEDTEDTFTFADMDGSHWANDAIVKCAKEGILRGYDDNTYQPDALVTRAEFASILLRTAKIDTAGEWNAVFKDVTEDDWFYNNVYAAKKAGIISGVSATEFLPNAFITREEMTTMVYRLAKSKIEKTAEVEFADFDTVSSWAQEAVQALAAAEIVNGTGDDLFEPAASVTRAMAAQIASRLMELY